MSKLRVFMYHKINSAADFLTVTPEDFKLQIAFISKHYTVIHLKDLIEHIQDGKVLPSNAALITFDDGYEDNFTNAYPILKELQLPFTIFLVAHYIGKSIEHDGKLQQFLSAEQLLKMQDLASFGYHSFKHDNLMDTNEDDIAKDIDACDAVYSQLPVKVHKAWAYTYGAYPKKDRSRFEVLQNIFKTKGISLAFRIGNRINSTPIKNIYAIERIDVRGNESKFRFRLKARFGKIL